MSGHLRIYAELRGYGARGPRYQVRMNKPDGMVIVNATTEPLYAAARVLHSKGVIGRLQLWDNVRPYCRLQGDIERLAGMTVSETKDGIGLRRYVERAEDDADLADEYDAAQERGDVAANGQHAALPDGKSMATVADIGLTHKDIHEARQIRGGRTRIPEQNSASVAIREVAA